MIRCLFH